MVTKTNFLADGLSLTYLDRFTFTYEEVPSLAFITFTYMLVHTGKKIVAVLWKMENFFNLVMSLRTDVAIKFGTSKSIL